ncbi:tape measure protein [Salmonella enterica]|nr:tail tape measure protein [Salmonella enterica]EDI0544225.1 tail tape measure protein [Salmonella enterica subsp. enterica serovar Adelaide]
MSKNVGTIYYEIEAQTGKLLAARGEAVKSLSDIQRSANKTDKAITKLNTKMKYLARGIHAAIAAIAFDAIAGQIKQFVQMAEEIKNLSARIALLSKDAATARDTFESLKRISNETGATLADTTSLWEGLTRSLKDAGASNAQILNITATVQKMGAIGGASAEQMRNAMQQFRQAIDGGVVKAEEFNSIMENTPYVLDQVAKQMGMTKGQLRKHMLDGKLSALDMVNAIQKSTDQVNTEFDKLPRTSGQAVNQLGNEFKTLMAKADQAFGATDTFVKLIDSSTGTLKVFGEKAYEVGGYIDDIKEAFNDLVKMKNDIVETFGDTGKAIHDAAIEAFALVPGIKSIVNGYNMLNDLIQKNGTSNKYIQDPLAEMTYSMDKAHELLGKIQDEYKKNNQPKNPDRDQKPIIGNGNGDTDDDNGNGNGNGNRTRKPSPYEILGDAGRNAALSLLPKQGAYEAFKQEQEMLEAAYKQGKIKQEQYQQALLASKTKYHDTLARINEQQDKLDQERRQKDWDSAVSPEQKALGAIDPIQQIQNEWAIRKQMLLDLGATEATIKEQQLAHEQQLLDLKWQQWQAQSDTNHLIGVMLGGLGDGATNAITGLLNGTQSLKEAFANIGSTILNDVVGAITEMGMEYIRQQVLGAAQAQASQAATTAATTAQLGTITAAAAPAAAAVSTATMGGAAGIAMSALSGLMSFASSLFGGRRYNGGAVLGGKMYRVGEHGKPELFQSGSKQYMLPGENGRVVSNRDAFGGSGDVINNYNITVNTTNGWSEKDSRELEATIKRISMAQIREQATRPGGLIQPRR